MPFPAPRGLGDGAASRDGPHPSWRAAEQHYTTAAFQYVAVPWADRERGVGESELTVEALSALTVMGEARDDARQALGVALF